MKSRSIVALCVGVLLLIAVGTRSWLLADRPLQAASETTPSSTGNGRVSGLGRIEPASRVIKLAPAEAWAASLAELRIQEGEEVEKGAVLAVLSDYAKRQAAVAAAREEVALATARHVQVLAGAKAGDIAAAQARISQAIAMETFHEAEVSRAEKLIVSRVATAEDLNAKRAERDRARAIRREAEKAAEALAQVRAEDLAVSSAQLRAAEAALSRADAELRLSELRAPISGRILKIHSRPGEMASSAGVLEMADLNQLDAVVEVFEGDIPRVRDGMSALIRVPGSGLKAQGRVSTVGWRVGRRDVLSPDPVADLDSRVVEVRVRLNEPDARQFARLTFTQVHAIIGE
jgi:HlyD family secretion protein